MRIIKDEMLGVISGILILFFLSTSVFTTTARDGAARPELLLQTGHTSSVTQVVFGPDNQWIATAGADSLIKIWQTETGRELRTLAGHAGAVHALSRSRDGKFIVSGATDRTVRIWEVNSGKQVRSLKTDDSPVEAVAFSADGSKLAAVGARGLAKIWDAASGGEINDLSTAGVDFTALAFSPDGQTIAVSATDSTIKVWNVTGVKKPRIYPSDTERVITLAFSADGALMAAGGVGKKVTVWQTGKSRPVFTFSGHRDKVLAASFLSADEIVTVDAGHGVHFWNPLNGNETRAAKNKLSNLYTKAESVAVGPGSDLVLFSYGNRTATLITPVSGETVRTFTARTIGYESVAFSADGNWLAAGSRDNTVRLWDLRSGDCVSTLTGHTGYVRAIVFHPDNQRLISAGIDESIRVWNIITGGDPIVLTQNAGGINSLAVSASNRILAAGVASGSVRLWELEKLTELKSLTGHSGEVNSVAISADGATVVSAGVDQTVRTWDSSTASQKSVVKQNAPVRAVAISSDGRRIASGGMDGVLNLTDVHGAVSRKIPTDSGDRILTLAFSPNGEWLVAGTQDKSIRAWRAADGSRKPITDRHNGPVTSAAFAADGKWLATASEDGSISLWDADTFSRAATLVSISGSDDWLVVTPEGYFDGSPDSWRQLLWRFSSNISDVRSVEVFFNEFYQPGVLTDLMIGRGLPDKQNISEKDRRQPLVEISAPPVGPADNSARIRIKVSEAPAGPGVKGSGAKDVRLFRNGSLVRSWNSDVLSGTKGSRMLDAVVPIIHGKNEFTAYAFNADNVKSDDANLNITGPDELRRNGAVHIFAIGVGRYENPELDLKYIDSDVGEFADTLKQKQEELGLIQEIRVTRLVNEDATKARIITTLRDSARASSGTSPRDGAEPVLNRIRPEDTVVVYFSGHGFTLGKRFYMVPHDVGRGSSLRDLPGIAKNSISDLELQDALQHLDARNILLIIDACNSGQALESEDKRMGPMNNKGLAQLAYEKGMFVLTASQPDETAYVSKERKRSYLTFALIDEGLKLAKADTGPKDGRIYLREWFDYASRRVPDLRNEAIEKYLKEEGKDLRVSKVRLGIQRPKPFYRKQRDPQEMMVAIVAGARQ